MKLKKLLSALLALALLCTLLPVPVAAADAAGTWADNIPAMLSAGPYVEGEVIVAVEPACAGTFDLLAALGLRESLDGEALMTAPVDTARGGEAVLTYIQDPTRTTEELLYALAGDRRVAFAEPNYRASASSLTGGDGGSDATAYADFPAHETVPDLTELQWGQKAIHTPGFEAGKGNMSGDPIIVAVMDGAVDFSHPDLAPVAYAFTPEQQKALGCGEHGFSILTDDGLPAFQPDSYLAAHGTHVAGIIGAAWDGRGVSGVASNVQIISVQIYDDESHDTLLAAVIRGYDFIRRARAAGVDIRIVNNSWGSHFDSLSLNAAVRALGEDYGIVNFFAAGNNGMDLKEIEFLVPSLADNPYAVVVGAAESDGALSKYSNRGDLFVDLAAPGSGILSAVTPAEASYLPDAESVWYEGFEGDPVRCALMQSGAEAPESGIVTDRSFTGAHALRAELDPSAAEPINENTYLYLLTLELQDAPSFARYLGLSFCGTAYQGIYSRVDGKTGELIDIEGRSCSYGNTWAGAWMDLSADYAYLLDEDTNTLRVTVELEADSTTDTVWIDAVGLGNARVPYEGMDGTSMACPMVTGAAAVLLAAQPDLEGADLAALVCEKVRQNVGLEGLVRTAGVFDFDGIAATPPAPEPDPIYPLYDTELPLDTDTGDPYQVEKDRMGDAETQGFLTGLGDKLYYLPATAVPDEFLEYVCSTLYAYDLTGRTWSGKTDLPELLALRTVSVAADQDDTLLVMGQTLETWNAGGTAWEVFACDCGRNEWTDASADGLDGGLWKLFRMDGALYLLECGRMDWDGRITAPASLWRYDVVNGLGEMLAVLEGAYHPFATRVVAREGSVWIYDSANYVLDRVRTDAGAETESVSLPWVPGVGGVPAVTDDNVLLLAGLTSADGRTDTWRVAEADMSLAPLHRKAATNCIFAPAATVYRGRLYVIGFAAGEKETRFFRSNAVATLNDPIPVPGNPDYDSAYDAGPAPAAEKKEEKKDETPAVPYTDVPEDAWYASDVAFVTEAGLFEGFGDGTFGPEIEMDRAMAVQVLWKLAGKPGVNRYLPFDDVSGDDWFSEAVRWAFDKGIAEGDGGHFDPNAPVTREQFATMVYRFLKAQGRGFEGLWSFPLDFADADIVSDWAYEGMCWLVMNGIIKGMGDGTLNPQGVLTRAQTAALLARVAALLEAE